jgi:hypothetical protein
LVGLLNLTAELFKISLRKQSRVFREVMLSPLLPAEPMLAFMQLAKSSM